MPLANSGIISLGDIAQITKGSNTLIGLGDADTRYLLGDLKGAVKISDAYGKPLPGSISLTTPGTYSFLVPAYQSFSVEVVAAGGGGGGGDNHNIYGYGNCGYDGGNGGYSQFGSVIADGGGYGGGNCSGHTGTNGGGSGGTVTVGGGGAGGNGGWPQQGSGNGYPGGAGGKTLKSWTFLSTSGYPVWNTYITVVVGAGGAAAPQNATAGQNGYVNISWS